MNKVQINKLSMYRAVQALLQTTTETSGVTPLPAKLTAFSGQIAAIDELDLAQIRPTTGPMANRNRLIQETVHAALELAGFARSYAHEQQIEALTSAVQITATDFSRLRLTRRLVLAQQVHDAAAPYVTQLANYGVTAATLADLQTKIDTARTALSQPRNIVALKKAATESMAKAFTAADMLLEIHIDPLVFALRNTSPEFYANYRAARQLVHAPGVRAQPPLETQHATAAAAHSVSGAAPAGSEPKHEQLAA